VNFREILFCEVGRISLLGMHCASLSVNIFVIAAFEDMKEELRGGPE
jgi:hypothetical protein